MFSITASIYAGSPEDVRFFPSLHPVSSVPQALMEIQNGYEVILIEEDWAEDARRVLIGLGADLEWAKDVVARSVEYRRVAACLPPSLP